MNHRDLKYIVDHKKNRPGAPFSLFNYKLHNRICSHIRYFKYIFSNYKIVDNII